MIDDILASRRLLVCVGAGGVGKTTVSAALALRAALGGKPTLVLTIDPARRLATSLGVAGLDQEERRISIEALAAAGLPAETALWAMMLDVRRTFDEMVARLAPDEGTRDRLYANAIYRQIAGRLAGSHEYAAMEKVHDIVQRGGYPLVVLDTPPSRSALDFLDAPRKLAEAIDSPAIQWLVRPYLQAGSWGLRALGAGSAFLLRQLARFVGARFLDDIAAFLIEFNAILGGFRRRADEVAALFRGPEVGFVVVAAPDPQAIDEAVFLHRQLRHQGLAVDAFVINRVHGLDEAGFQAPSDLGAQLRAAAAGAGLAPAAAEAAAAALIDAWREGDALARMDAAEIARLRRSCGEGRVLRVPLLDEDVHSLAGLAAVGRAAGGAAPA